VKEVHEVLVNLLVILALFHMTAALVHHWVFWRQDPEPHVAGSSQANMKGFAPESPGPHDASVRIHVTRHVKARFRAKDRTFKSFACADSARKSLAFLTYRNSAEEQKV
jgi:hypothetical protein